MRVAQVGFEPGTDQPWMAGLVDIPGSKPRWSASCLPSRVVVQYPEQDSNLQTSADQRFASVPEPDRSAGWRIWA